MRACDARRSRSCPIHVACESKLRMHVALRHHKVGDALSCRAAYANTNRVEYIEPRTCPSLRCCGFSLSSPTSLSCSQTCKGQARAKSLSSSRVCAILTSTHAPCAYYVFTLLCGQHRVRMSHVATGKVCAPVWIVNLCVWDGASLFLIMAAVQAIILSWQLYRCKARNTLTCSQGSRAQNETRFTSVLLGSCFTHQPILAAPFHLCTAP
jgi:hypothetical protein